jgi:uncharacterized membrane protein YdjX (TVP38/TMEM64 family)
MTTPADPRPPSKDDLLAGAMDFLNNMDARAWRAVWVTLGLFAVVAAMLVVGRLVFGEEVNHAVERWLGGAERDHWGLPAAILIFTLTAFIGAPQFVLIAACVVAFGPETGFWYAWIATAVSGAVTFLLGRVSGAASLLKRFGGATGGRFSKFMGDNAFWASFIIRFVPSGPFIVVNMAMGAAGMKFLPFMGGLVLGVLPKTAIVAFAGDGIMDAVEGNLGAAAIAGGIALVIWLGLVFVVQPLARKLRKADMDKGADQG